MFTRPSQMRTPARHELPRSKLSDNEPRELDQWKPTYKHHASTVINTRPAFSDGNHCKQNRKTCFQSLTTPYNIQSSFPTRVAVLATCNFPQVHQQPPLTPWHSEQISCAVPQTACVPSQPYAPRHTCIRCSPIPTTNK